MASAILKVDKKGRIHIPKTMRERLGINKAVRGRIEGGNLVIEPLTNLLDKLARQASLHFKSVETALPRLRRAAEEQSLKER